MYEKKFAYIEGFNTNTNMIVSPRQANPKNFIQTKKKCFFELFAE